MFSCSVALLLPTAADSSRQLPTAADSSFTTTHDAYVAGGVRAVPGLGVAAARRAGQGPVGRGEGARGARALPEHARQAAAAAGEVAAGVRQGPERGRPAPGAARQGARRGPQGNQRNGEHPDTRIHERVPVPSRCRRSARSTRTTWRACRRSWTRPRASCRASRRRRRTSSRRRSATARRTTRIRHVLGPPGLAAGPPIAGE